MFYCRVVNPYRIFFANTHIGVIMKNKFELKCNKKED